MEALDGTPTRNLELCRLWSEQRAGFLGELV
jgi:hypothetical protein